MNTEFEQDRASLQYQMKRAVSYEYLFVTITAVSLVGDILHSISKRDLTRPAILLGLIFTAYSALQGLRFLKAQRTRTESDLDALRESKAEFADEKRRFRRLWLAGIVVVVGVGIANALLRESASSFSGPPDIIGGCVFQLLHGAGYLDSLRKIPQRLEPLIAE